MTSAHFRQNINMFLKNMNTFLKNMNMFQSLCRDVHSIILHQVFLMMQRPFEKFFIPLKATNTSLQQCLPIPSPHIPTPK